MSSDKERVYLLDQLGQLESMAMNAMLNMRGIRRVQSQYNALVALELKTEGKLRWRLRAEGDENGSLANAFLGATTTLRVGCMSWRRLLVMFALLFRPGKWCGAFGSSS